MKFWWLVLFFPYTSLAFTIQGNAAWAKGQKIQLEQYQEYFLYSSKKLGETEINENGAFSFDIESDQIYKYRLVIADKIGELYLEPDADYSIKVRPYNGPDIPVLSKEKIVGIEIEKDGRLAINTKIEKYNLQFDQFIQANAAAIIQKRANPLIATFKERLKNQLLSEPSSFVVNYVTYSIAQLEMTKNYSRKEMIEEYIKGSPVLFYNPQYDKFFVDMFTEFFRFFASNDLSTRLNKAINLFQNADSLNAVLETNVYFRQLDAQQKELMIINELYHQAENKRFQKSKIVSILKGIATTTLYAEHRLLLNEMLKRFDKLASSSPAPDFSFTDLTTNKQLKLSDFKGKYVYLDFWASWCKPCIEEMEVMQEMYQQYKDHIEFVSISIDDKSSRAERFLKKRNFTWTFGHANINEVKNLYDVRIIPMYYLINPEGALMLSPAQRPTGDIERTFYKIKKEAQENNTKDLPSWKIKPGKK